MKAYELINGPESFCKFTLAVDENGLVCFADSPRAKAFCIVGAIKRAYPGRMYDVIHTRLGIEPYDLVEWNNAPERTWEEVHNRLKEADL